MYVWMKVTQDKYEHPVAVADSVQELSRITGDSVNSIRSWMSHYKSGRLKTRKFVKVNIGKD